MKNVFQILSSTDFQNELNSYRNFGKFSRIFGREMTIFLKEIGCTEIDITSGHYFINGYFIKGKSLLYFSTGDVRYRNTFYLEKLNTGKELKYYLPMLDMEKFKENIKHILLPEEIDNETSEQIEHT